MKKLLLISTLALFGLVSCSDDDSYDNNVFLTTSSPIPHRYKSHIKTVSVTLSDLIEEFESSGLEGQASYAFMVATQKIEVHSIRYATNIRGQDITASGIVAVPSGIAPRGIVFFPHFFISDKSSAPTEKMKVLQLIFSFLGYILITPDNIGFGETVNMPTAPIQNAINGEYFSDMLFATQEYLLAKKIKVHKHISIVGYSLGGGHALAFQQYIEENNIVGINKVYAGGGMYAPQETLEYLKQNPYTDFSIAIPNIIISINYWDNLELDFSKVFKEPLLSNYKEWILSKQYFSMEISEKLGKDIRKILTTDFLSGNNVEYEKFSQSLSKYSLLGWTPQHPIILYHSPSDTYVPYLNTEAFYNKNKNSKQEIVLKTYEQGHTSWEFVKWMFKDILKDLKR